MNQQQKCVVELRPFPMWGPHLVGKADEGEDDFVIDFFNGEKGLTVVDVGAADGVTGSNSFRLITEYGWTGLLIEPHPAFTRYLKKLYKMFPCNVSILEVAIDKEDGEKTFHFPPMHAHGMGTISEEFRYEAQKESFECPKTGLKGETAVKTLTLNSVLENSELEIDEIDFLSIDTEGHDLVVLESLDFEKYSPKIICIEQYISKVKGEAERWTERLRLKMKNLGYFNIKKTHSNLLFS
jgi:FkbM family methyltransferase